MSHSKNQLVQAALTELGLSSYSFDLSVDQMTQALVRLDSMLSEWNGRGIRLGYPISSDPTMIDGNADSRLPDWAYEAVITNLALRLGPSYGKTPNPVTVSIARHALNTVLARTALPNEMQLNTLPIGAGAKRIDESFTPSPTPSLDVGSDAELTFN